MFGLGPTELVVIAVIVLFIFGAKRLPEIGKGLGGAIREFRNIKKDFGSNEPSDAIQNDKKAIADNDATKSFEAKLSKKVGEQVPGVKKVLEVKDKVENIKKMIE